MPKKTRVRKKNRKRRSDAEILADLEGRLRELQRGRRDDKKFSPGTLREHRDRLELSAADYAALVGVSLPDDLQLGEGQDAPAAFAAGELGRGARAGQARSLAPPGRNGGLRCHAPGSGSVALAVALLSGAGLSQGDPWPGFRGVRATGVSEGHATPTRWSVPESENVVWRTPLPGLAHSSPVVWGDRVFVTSAVREQGSSDLSSLFGSPGYGSGDPVEDEGEHDFRLYCLDRDSGEILVAAQRPRRRAKGQASPQVDPRQLDPRL